MPREAWALSPEEIVIREYDETEVGADEVRIRSVYGAAKHGTEMAIIKGYGRRRGAYDEERCLFVTDEAPVTDRGTRIGNMVVGDVEAVGHDVATLSPGDRVLAYGPFREMHTVKEDDCWKMPGDLSWKSAVCLDPADFAMAAVRDGNVRVGDAVAVFGMGAIGLLVVQMARLAGARPVIAVEPLANRRQVAEMCGADIVLDPTQTDVGLAVRRATEDRGADVTIEYSGSAGGLQEALRSVAFGGTVVAGAFPGPYPAGLDLGAEAHHNIPNLVFSRACSEPNREYPRWTEDRIYATCWRLLTAGQLSGEAIVQPVVAFGELVCAYPKIASEPGANVKLGVTF